MRNLRTPRPCIFNRLVKRKDFRKITKERVLPEEPICETQTRKALTGKLVYLRRSGAPEVNRGGAVRVRGWHTIAADLLLPGVRSQAPNARAVRLSPPHNLRTGRGSGKPSAVAHALTCSTARSIARTLEHGARGRIYSGAREAFEVVLAD